MKFLLTLTSILLSYSLFGQVIVNSMSLPDIGDELDYTIFSDYQDTMDYRASGEDMNWTFEGFNAVNAQTEVYTDISTTSFRDSFPDANMLLEFGGFESAAIRTDSSLAILGVIVEGLGGLGIELNVDLDEPFRLRTTPFEYGDVIEDNFEVAFSFSASIIPGLDSFDIGIPGATIDSLRFTTSISKREEAIGWGTLDMLGQQNEVLQIQENSNTSTTIEVGVNAFGNFLWLNAAAFLGDMVDAFGGNQNTVTYKFLTASNKRSVVEFSENRVQDTTGNNMLVVNGRTSADFLSNTDELLSDYIDIKISPNPASDRIQITGSDLSDRAHVIIYNINGLRVLSVSDIGTGSSIDISAIPAGSYIVHYNSGSDIAVRKLIIQE